MGAETKMRVATYVLRTPGVTNSKKPPVNEPVQLHQASADLGFGRRLIANGSNPKRCPQDRMTALLILSPRLRSMFRAAAPSGCPWISVTKSSTLCVMSTHAHILTNVVYGLCCSVSTSNFRAMDANRSRSL